MPSLRNSSNLFPERIGWKCYNSCSAFIKQKTGHELATSSTVKLEDNTQKGEKKHFQNKTHLFFHNKVILGICTLNNTLH